MRGSLWMGSIMCMGGMFDKWCLESTRMTWSAA